jgi:hypothetical protein
MGLLTFALNVTLDGCNDHREGIADDEMLDYFTHLMDEAGGMLGLAARVEPDALIPIIKHFLEKPAEQRPLATAELGYRPARRGEGAASSTSDCSRPS